MSNWRQKINKQKINSISYNSHPALIYALALCLVIAAASFFAISILQPKTIATSISMQFNGVEKGLYPDSTRFSHLDLVKEDVLKYVFKESKLSYEPKYAAAFSVEPVVPGNMIKNLTARRAAGEDYTYYPNEFVIKIIPNRSLGLTHKMATTLAENFEVGYKTFFEERFTYPFLDLKDLVENFKYKDYDYPDYEVVIDSLFNVIDGYLKILEKDAPTFKASNGYTFSTVREGMTFMRTIELKRIASLVRNYSLTKDYNLLLVKYNYANRIYSLNKDMELKNVTVKRELLNVVNKNKATMMLEGVSGETVGVSVVNKIYDDIASEVTTSEQKAADWSEQIVILQNRIDEIKNSTQTSLEKRRATIEVDKLSEEHFNTIKSWVDQITLMSQEYFMNEYENAITSVYKVSEVSNFSFASRVLIALLIGVTTSIIGYLAPFRNWKGFQSRNSKKKSSLHHT